MRNIFAILSFMFAVIVPTASADQRFIETDNVVIGKPGSTNPALKFRGKSNQVRVNTTSNKLEFTNDGSVFQLFGSGSGGGGDGLNLLTLNGGNNDAEQGIVGWTASGGSFTAVSSSPLNGLQSFQWTGSAIGQTLDSTAYATPFGAGGRKCQVNLPFVAYSGTTNDYALQVIDGSGNILATTPVVAIAGVTAPPLFQAFDCPTPPTTMKLRLVSNVASPAALQFDDAFLGIGRRSINTFGAIVTAWTPYAMEFKGDVGQTQPVAPSTRTLNQWTWRRVGDSLKVHGNMAWPNITGAVNGVGCYRATLPIVNGTQLQIDTAKLPLVLSALEYGIVGIARVRDNANNMMLQATPAADGTSIAFVGKSGPNGVTTATGVADGCFGSSYYGYTNSNAPTSFSADFEVPILGWGAERAPVEGNTYDTVGWRVDANLGSAGINSNQITGVINFPGLPIQAPNSWNIINNAGRGVSPALLTCTGTASATGTACPATADIGIQFNLPKAQDVKACVSFTSAQNAPSGSAIDSYFRIVETSLTNGTTILQDSKSAVGARVDNGIQNSPITLCANLTFGSAGPKALRLYVNQNQINSTPSHVIVGSRGPAGGGDVHWTVEPINEEMPAPVFSEIARKPDTSSPNWRVESAILTGGTCAIASQSGWISTSTAGGPNNAYCTVAITPGKWSSPPACSVTNHLGGGNIFCQFDTAPSNSSLLSFCYRSDGQFVAQTRSIICMGPK